ncbi:hypothetical protein AAMO2058_000873000 [Amorphochlora amoebiformis]
MLSRRVSDVFVSQVEFAGVYIFLLCLCSNVRGNSVERRRSNGTEPGRLDNIEEKFHLAQLKGRFDEAFRQDSNVPTKVGKGDVKVRYYTEDPSIGLPRYLEPGVDTSRSAWRDPNGMSWMYPEPSPDGPPK